MPLSKKFLKSFAIFASNTLITGYDSDESGMGENKSRFKRDSCRILKELATLMGLPKGSYDVRFNQGGPAVSGDPILHGENIYVNMAQSSMGRFYSRSCKGRKDYSGGQNRWMNWSELENLETVAAKLKIAADSGR